MAVPQQPHHPLWYCSWAGQASPTEWMGNGKRQHGCLRCTRRRITTHAKPSPGHTSYPMLGMCRLLLVPSATSTQNLSPSLMRYIRSALAQLCPQQNKQFRLKNALDQSEMSIELMLDDQSQPASRPPTARSLSGRCRARCRSRCCSQPSLARSPSRRSCSGAAPRSASCSSWH